MYILEIHYHSDAALMCFRQLLGYLAIPRSFMYVREARRIWSIFTDLSLAFGWFMLPLNYMGLDYKLFMFVAAL